MTSIAFQSNLTRVVTLSTKTTHRLLIHFIGFQLSNESILNWLLLSTVHSTTLNTCYLHYILTLHRVSFALPPSISSPNLVSTMLLTLVLVNMLHCWPFSLQLPLSSAQIYRLLHCLQIKSKTHLFSGASISGP